jgi:Fe2+ or Zn2+ uptake regulation protein
MSMTVEPPAIEDRTNTVLDFMTAHGYRSTNPRRQIVETVLRQSRPFTAEQVVAKLPEIGRATVYRTLEVLASIEIVHRILNPGGFPLYVVGQPGHRHHLVCTGCGSVIEFTECPIDELVTNLTRDTKFAISSHHLEVTGLCPSCQAR